MNMMATDGKVRGLGGLRREKKMSWPHQPSTLALALSLPCVEDSMVVVVVAVLWAVVAVMVSLEWQRW